ncbi:MAG TPA: hypothetical protein VHJ82_07835 [Actinomycetota bacterium]|nr:hypothetical protein [Actinomycetota bacterium]
MRHQTPGAFDVYLEVGAKRVFACAVDWPGWCRSGPDETAALQALLEYGPRYAAVLRSARLGFEAPAGLDDFRVVERLKGNATTDFGAPGVIPSADRASTIESDYARLEKVLRAAWRALDAARKRAQGKVLSKGPRGGGRELDGIVRHVVDADRSYLSGLGWKVRSSESADPVDTIRKAIIDGLRASARGEIPATGPRGGTRWPARYFVRRVAWHAITHAWEIERRLSPPAHPAEQGSH